MDLFTQNCITIQDIKIYLDFNIVTKNDKQVTLSSLEYRLLAYLAVNKGKILVSSWIIDNVWGNSHTLNYKYDLSNIHTVIYRIRKKLGTNIIETRRGIGYGII